MRGDKEIYFINSDDGNYKDNIRNAKRKMEVPMEAPMLCNKRTRCQASSSETERIMTNPEHACIVEAHESTRQRVESSLPKHHDDHIAGKGYNSVVHDAQVYSNAASDENTGCESSSGQGMEKARSNSNKKEVFLEAQREKIESPRCSLH